MTKIKILIANLVTYSGAIIEAFGAKLAQRGIDLHVKFKTPLGEKFKKLAEISKFLAEHQSLQEKQTEEERQKQMMKEYDQKERNKIVNMIKGERK